MREWIEGVAGPAYASALMWTLLALIALLVVLVLLKIVRGFTFGTFVAGGRNRRARLAVMDATAVDSHRRLVLVRRDDVEHLLLIGGPTDVVVEHGIGAVRHGVSHAAEEAIAPVPAASPVQPVSTHTAPVSAAETSLNGAEQEIEAHWIEDEPYRQHMDEAPEPVRPPVPASHTAAEPIWPAEPDRTPPVAPASRHERPVQEAVQDLAPAAPQRPTPPQFEPPRWQTAPRPEPRAMPEPPAAQSPRPQPAATQPAQPERASPPRPAQVEPAFGRPHQNVQPPQPVAAPAFAASAHASPFAGAEHVDDGGLDDALMEELVLTLDEDDHRQQPQPQNDLDASLDDEMARLLSELSSEKR